MFPLYHAASANQGMLAFVYRVFVFLSICRKICSKKLTLINSEALKVHPYGLIVFWTYGGFEKGLLHTLYFTYMGDNMTTDCSWFLFRFHCESTWKHSKKKNELAAKEERKQMRLQKKPAEGRTNQAEKRRKRKSARKGKARRCNQTEKNYKLDKSERQQTSKNTNLDRRTAVFSSTVPCTG